MPVSYTLLLHPRFRSLLADGSPNVGGKIYTYAAGTTTLATTYSDPELTTPNTNPVVLDAAGQADIWFSGSYKLIVQDANGVQLYSADNLYGFKSDLFCSFPEQDEDKLIAWDNVDGKLKNSTQTLTDVEHAVVGYLTFLPAAEAALVAANAAAADALEAAQDATDAANTATQAAAEAIQIANQAAADAIAATHIPAWDPATAYTFPMMAAGSDGHTYRWTGSPGTSGINPATGGSGWVDLSPPNPSTLYLFHTCI
jgi:hypothetical protein